MGKGITSGYVPLGGVIVSRTIADHFADRPLPMGLTNSGHPVGVAAGVVGGGMHIVMHAFGKITLFFCAGAIMVASHKTEISDMHGLGRRMPVTMTAFFIGALSIIGLPPCGGTWSKWYLMIGTIEADKLILMVVLMASSLLNIAYLLPIPIKGFLYPDPDADGSETTVREAPLISLIALSLTAVGCIVLFFYPQPLYELATDFLEAAGLHGR